MGSAGSERRNKQRTKLVWLDLADRYVDPQECLAAFLAFETAEVLDGVKPSTLINFADRSRRCGRNFYRLWKIHGEDLIRDSGLQVKVMADRPGSLLVLMYDSAALARLLGMRGAQVLLTKAGYHNELTVDGVLAELSRRFTRGRVPHEIGIVLGYPFKDVAGFMGVSNLRFTCQGPWRIYGDPRRSLQLAESHRQCRSRMAGRLLSGCQPRTCLDASFRGAGDYQGLVVASC